MSLESCSQLRCAGVRRTGWPRVGGMHIHEAPTVMRCESERDRETVCVCKEDEDRDSGINPVGGIRKKIL